MPPPRVFAYWNALGAVIAAVTPAEAAAVAAEPGASASSTMRGWRNVGFGKAHA